MNIHSSLRMQECRHESENYNYRRIQLSNNKFINDLTCVGSLEKRELSFLVSCSGAEKF